MSPIRKFIVNRRISTTIMVAFFIVSIVPISFLVASYYVSTTQAIDKTTVSQLEGSSKWQTEIIKGWFNDHFQPLRVIATSKRIQGSSAEINDLFMEYKNGYDEYDSFGFIDKQGVAIVNTAGKTGFSLKDRAYFNEAMQGKSSLSEVLVARAHGNACLVFAVPVYETNSTMVKGVLVGSVPITHLQKIVGNDMLKIGNSFVLDKFGNLISAPKGLYSNKFEHTVVPAPKMIQSFEKQKTNQGWSQYTDENNKKFFGVYNWIPEYNVFVFTKKAVSEAYDDAGAVAFRANFIIGYTTILLVLPLIYWLVRKLTKPLDEIAEVVEEISNGNLSRKVKPFMANKELQQIGERINRMSSNLESSRRIIQLQIKELEVKKGEAIDKNDELTALNEQMTAMNEELTAQNEEIMSQNEDLITAYDLLTVANQNLELMATTDQLTSIYNRRYLMDKLKKEIMLSKRNKRPLSILLMDLDYFKTINDTFGHAEGDRVLKTITQLINDTIRATDVLARFGGEEFLILAPDTDQEGAARLAEKIRSIVENHIFKVDGREVQVTLSIGVSELTSYEGDPEKLEDMLIFNADKSLYRAKNRGRNRIEWEA